MLYRNIGKSGLKVSEISLGSWLTYGEVTKKVKAFSIIDKAYELGINLFDTSNIYAMGKAEEVVGEALRKYPRSSYVLATKVFFPMGSGPNDRGLSRKHIYEQAHDSLKRLGVDYVDIYYCHRFDIETPVEETLRAIDDLIRQGKVLYAGVSQWSVSQMQEAMQLADQYLLDRIIVHQPLYNMLDCGIEREIIPFCEKNGIGQVVFSPLAQGVLTGKYRRGMVLPEGSRATNYKVNMFMNRYLAEDMMDKTEKLQFIADQAGIPLAHMALAWILRNSNVASALTGASKPEQVENNTKAAGLKLSPDVLLEIEKTV